MNDIKEALYLAIGIWGIIILFLTAPLWLLPYVIYRVIKNSEE
jgi:hypothetical protein